MQFSLSSLKMSISKLQSKRKKAAIMLCFSVTPLRPTELHHFALGETEKLSLFHCQSNLTED